jgi:ureidoglycolate lyase
MLLFAPLTKAGFAPFGDVVETGDVKPKLINEGFAERFDDLANIDVAAEGGEVNVSLFVGSARPAPLVIKLMERHPLGSQLFMPLNETPWLVVVCADPGIPSSYRAFAASGRQGVNYARNCWHHPLLVVGDVSPFVVVDRKGAGDNLEEKWLEEANWLRVAPDGAAEAYSGITAKQGLRLGERPQE